MPKAKLDSAFCLTAQCKEGKKKTDYYDTSITGFVLECRSSGGKSYYLRYQDEHGGQRQHRIAGYGDVSFDKAKKEAQRLRSQVVLGGDPAAAKEERRSVPTFAELAKQHLAHAKTYQRSYTTTEMYVNNHILPRWGKLRLTEIKQQDIAKWLAEKSGEGLAAATVLKIRMIFSRSFELALQWDMPGLVKNPVKGIPNKPVNNAIERFLTPRQAERLLTAAASSRNTQLVHIIKLLLLTGARVGELLTAKWEHVDVERKKWLIPTSKSGKHRHVPLSASAIETIEALPKFKDCPYLIPNPDTRKPFTGIKNGWDKARTDAGLPHFRIHDLRHSAASFMINSGADLYTVGKVLGHASMASTQRYAHVANDTLMAAVEAGAKKMQGGISAASVKVGAQ